MGRICKEEEDAAVAVCSSISCTAFTNCDSIQCNSFRNCSWWNVPCHVARAACVAAAAVARAACWVARSACVIAAETAKAACIAAAAIARAACELVNVVLDIIGLIVNLILSIPIIGGIIRTILNWVTEIIWRVVGLIDFLGSLVGIRPRKKMYFGVVVPSVDGIPIVPDVDIQRQVDAAVSFYDATCNINLIFTGICHTNVSPPDAGLVVGCDAGGFFNDWWLAGSYFEFATATCKFTDSFRRVIGYGAEIVVFIVQDVTPSGTNGCSFASTHNYVVIEAKPTDQPFVASHEMGHACWLPHVSDPANLMNPVTPSANPTLTSLQISVIRWSKHCVYI
jgi:hypothetical protein